MNAGIDVSSGTIVDATECHIYDVFAGKNSAIKLATNSATTILKVDQVRVIPVYTIN